MPGAERPYTGWHPLSSDGQLLLKLLKRYKSHGLLHVLKSCTSLATCSFCTLQDNLTQVRHVRANLSEPAEKEGKGKVPL